MKEARAIMAFWTSWQQWEKLTLILTGLIILVMVYAYCMLLYNRWRIRRCAAIEAHEKEEEAELYPMLKLDDVPFGARALKQGVYVEGIWVANNSASSPSPHQPSTPIGSGPATPMFRPIPIRPASPVSSMALDTIVHIPAQESVGTQRPPQLEMDIVTANQYRYTFEPYQPGGIYAPVTSSSAPPSPRDHYRRGGMPSKHEKGASFHNRICRSSQMYDHAIPRLASSDTDETGAGNLGQDLGPRSPAEQSRASRFTKTLLRRRSSEEFRRKMSEIFNERIHMNVPADRLQFDPRLREVQKKRFRQSILGHFRPRGELSEGHQEQQKDRSDS